MTVKLLTEQHLEFLSLIGGCTGLYESTLVKMLIVGNHVTADIQPISNILFSNKINNDITKFVNCSSYNWCFGLPIYFWSHLVTDETDSEFEDEKVDDVTKATIAITKTTTCNTKATAAVSKSSNAVTKTTTAVNNSTAAVSKMTTAVSKTKAGVTKSTTAVSKTTTIVRDPFEFEIPGSQADISSSQESDVR